MRKLTFIWLIASVLFAGVITTSCSSDDDPQVENPDDKDDDDDDDDDEKKSDFDDSLLGSNYYLLILDGTSEAKISSKIVADYRPNDETKFLYVWDDTYYGGECSGPNFYGNVEEWTSLVVNTIGWSGAGFSIEDGVDLTAIDETYSLHLGMKSKDNAEHTVILYGTNGVEAEYIINSTVLPRDGEWYEIEIPMTKFFEQGLRYEEAIDEANVLAFLSGGVAGTILDVDAVFIYKPKAE